MQSLDTARVGQQWDEIVDQVAQRQARILIEAGGVPVAAIVPMSDLHRLAQLDEQRAQFLAALERTQAAFADVSDDELGEEIARALTAARATPSGPAGR